MTKPTLALAIAVAGCGRLGFGELAGRGVDGGIDGPAGELVTLVVTSDQYLAEPAGTPIAGATVLVERSGGTDRLTTDAAGIARFPAAGVIACHAIYKSELGWRGYSVTAPPAIRIELGGRPAGSPTHGMTLTLPPSATASSFTVRLPEHCASPPLYGASSMDLSYDVACEGTTPRVIGFALPVSGSQNPDLYLDGGLVTLANGAMHAITGSYLQVPVRAINIVNVPIAAAAVQVEVLARSGIDLTSLTPIPHSVTPGASTVHFDLGVVPGGETARLQVFAATPVAVLASSERIERLPAGGITTALDARTLLPPIDSLALDGPRGMRWTGGGTGGTITIVETISGGIQWDLYLDPSATSASVPPIPADLGAPEPKSPDVVSVVKLDVPGATHDALLPTIDRRWSLWPHDPVLLPDAGSSEARLLYIAALGPP